MRHICILLALCAVTTLSTAQNARAADTGSSTTTDPNFRWHNGQWWYWQAPQQHWMVWNGSEWQVHQPQARRATRSYSYMQEPNYGSGTQSFRSRGSSSGGRITNSFGNRDAGSKIRGQY